MRRNPDPSDTQHVAFVHLEACVAFDADPTEPGICSTCGWLEDDHPAPSDVAAAA